MNAVETRNSFQGSPSATYSLLLRERRRAPFSLNLSAWLYPRSAVWLASSRLRAAASTAVTSDTRKRDSWYAGCRVPFSSLNPLEQIPSYTQRVLLPQQQQKILSATYCSSAAAAKIKIPSQLVGLWKLFSNNQHHTGVNQKPASKCCNKLCCFFLDDKQVLWFSREGQLLTILTLINKNYTKS